MQRVFLDLNVLLDVLAEREPFLEPAQGIWSAAESGRLHGIVAGDSFSTLYYILRRASDHRRAMRGLALVRDIFEIVATDAHVINQALDSPLRDFEDAIQYHSAVHAQAQCIITRDLAGFRQADIPAISPAVFWAGFQTDDSD